MIASRNGFGAVAIETLLSQTDRPNKIVLWLDENIDGAVILHCLKSQQAFGHTIRRCRDIGPLTKILLALRKFRDAWLVIAYDDTLYPIDWLSSLLHSWRQNPNYVHCRRAYWNRLDEKNRTLPYYIQLFGSKKVALWQENELAGKSEEQLRKMFEHYKLEERVTA